MLITVKNKQSDLKISVVRAKEVILRVLEHEKARCDEISIFFVDSQTISELHDQFFDDPTPTDCIAFPIDEVDDHESYRILGEIFVCPKTALDFAIKKDKDPYKEVTLYIVHALLHLLGYDDREPKAKARMRRKEASLMKFLVPRSLE